VTQAQHTRARRLGPDGQIGASVGLVLVGTLHRVVVVQQHDGGTGPVGTVFQGLELLAIQDLFAPPERKAGAAAILG